jgi:hypothetical protein
MLRLTDLWLTYPLEPAAPIVSNTEVLIDSRDRTLGAIHAQGNFDERQLRRAE